MPLGGDCPGTVRLTMIMIYFTKVNTRCGGHARCISWHFVFALAMLIIIMVNLTIPATGSGSSHGS
jgi:hypothetical protein